MCLGKKSVLLFYIQQDSVVFVIVMMHDIIRMQPMINSYDYYLIKMQIFSTKHGKELRARTYSEIQLAIIQEKRKSI